MCNKMKTRKIGQSINEYVLVIVLVTLAGIGMQSYIKRGIQGIVKTSADTLAGEQTEGKIEVKNEAKRDWHPLAAAYKDRLIAGEFFIRERQGNSFYYNVYVEDPDNPGKIKKDRGIGVEDIATGNFTSLDIDGNPLPVVYDKYGKVLTGTQAAAYVQQGTIEQGLVDFKYKDPLHPLTFTADKKITVDTLSKYSGPQSLALADWHPAMKAYQTRMEEDKIRGFIQTEIKGSMVYYYQFTTDPKNRTLIGGENLRTQDFTQFGPDGFPVSTVNSKLTVLRTYNGGYMTDPVTKEIVGVTDINGNIYGQYQIVTISPVLPITGPATVAVPMRTKTIGNDTTHVTGAWEATYKMGTDIYKPKGNPPPIKE